MLRFVVRRILLMIPVLLGPQRAVVHLGARPARGPGAGPPGREGHARSRSPRSTRQYGFDQPLVQQFLIYTSQLLQGDFGISPRTGEPGAGDFIERFPATVELAIAALLFAIVVGIPLGYLAAKRAGGWLDTFAVGTSLAGVVIPVFVLAYMLKLVFAVGLPGPLQRAGRAAVVGSPGSADRRHPHHQLLRAGRAADPGVGRGLGRDPAPHPAGHRPRLHPAGDHRPDDPGLGGRRAERGLRPHRAAPRDSPRA